MNKFKIESMIAIDTFPVSEYGQIYLILEELEGCSTFTQIHSAKVNHLFSDVLPDACKQIHINQFFHDLEEIIKEQIDVIDPDTVIAYCKSMSDVNLIEYMKKNDRGWNVCVSDDGFGTVLFYKRFE